MNYQARLAYRSFVSTVRNCICQQPEEASYCRVMADARSAAVRTFCSISRTLGVMVS